MKKQIFVIMICVFLINTVFPLTASAFSGVYPTATIEFDNMSDEECYVTLLSSEPKIMNVGSVWDGNEENIRDNNIGREVWEKFVNYKDKDGYFYLQKADNCNVSKELSWIKPPSLFKVLLYYPKTDRFYISGICETYAYNSYYSVDMEKVSVENDILNVKRTYILKNNIIVFFVIIPVFLAVKLLVAFIGGYRGKKIFRFILFTNLLTAILSAVAVYAFSFSFDSAYLVFVLLILGLIVFIIEAFLYCINFKKLTDKRVTKAGAFIYAGVSDLIFLFVLYVISINFPSLS